MDGELLAQVDEYEDSAGIDITAVTKLKHADLWAASKKLGSQSALARHLGIRPQELGDWVNLRRVPPAEPVPNSDRWTMEYMVELESKLLVLTGKSWEELFPDELRENSDFLECTKRIEQTKRVQAWALEQYAISTSERLSIESQDPEELREALQQAMATLTEREQEVVKLRFGLKDGHCATLEEAGRVLKITRERVRQIEGIAIRKLQQPERSGPLLEYCPPPPDEYREPKDVWPSDIYGSKSKLVKNQES